MDRFEHSQSMFDDFELLAEVSQLLTLTDLDSVLQQVISLAARAVGASKASLFLHEDNQVDWSHIFTMRDLSADESVRVVTQVLDEGFAGWVYRHRQGDIITDTLTDDRWIVFPDDPVPVRSALCVPFVDGDAVIAVLTLVHPEAGHFTAYHLRLMTIITNQATIAIRNARLFNHLNEQRLRLQTVLQSMQDVLLVVDEQGAIILVNEAAMLLLNESDRACLVGETLAQWIQADSVFEPVVEIINAGLTRNDSWTFETRSDVHQIDYQVIMSQWEDPARDTLGYVIVMHDVTTLHDLHRFKDQMMRFATHDLRSPLALIAGYADMIGMDTMDSGSSIHQYVDIIKESVERMGRLIEDLLRVERIRSSPLELHEQTDIESLVKVVLVNTRPSAIARKQTFDSQLALDGIPRMIVDPVLLRQSMQNLIHNAIKYTPPGGEVMVYASYDANRFFFSVQDNGIGIPSEHVPYIFESFYRVNRDSSSNNGSGLGLSLVKDVINRHNGEVWVKSKHNQGSEFGFWLPLPPVRD